MAKILSLISHLHNYLKKLFWTSRQLIWYQYNNIFIYNKELVLYVLFRLSNSFVYIQKLQECFLNQIHYYVM